MANIGTGYDQFIGERPSQADPNQTEFYNKQTGQGFARPEDLATFANQQFGTSFNAGNVFGSIAQNASNANTQGSTVAATGGAPGSNPPQPTNPPSLPGGMGTTDAVTNAANQVQTLSQNVPNSYELYQKELKSRGIDTLIGQEADLGNSINAQEAALKPLLPENEKFNFPGGLKQLQDIGVTQDQLDLLAAKERAPIASALSDLLKSQSVIAQQIDRQTALSKYATQLQTDDYNAKVKSAQDAYSMALDSGDRAAKVTAAAQLFATTNNITSPYYLENGTTVVRTSDGYHFTSEKDFQQKSGMDVGTAQSQGLIQKPSATPLALKDAPTSYQEYVLAKQDGYKGTYSDYQTADANRKAKASGSTATVSAAKANHQEEVANHLEGIAGGDGYVSPEDWKKAQKAWVLAGYGTAASFKTNFSNYINPADPQDYK